MTLKRPKSFLNSPETLTVGSLLDYLKELEETWTEKDAKFLGEFRKQTINCYYYSKDTFSEGIGPAKIVYDGGLDFVILQAQEHD